MPNLTPKLNCRYGAPMGRADSFENDNQFNGRFYLRRIPLDRGGYDSGGAYWGIGRSLYGYESANGDIYAYLRADSRSDAKERILAKYPLAKFFR